MLGWGGAGAGGAFEGGRHADEWAESYGTE